MDELEQFIKANREAFDEHQPSSDSWKKIQEKRKAKTIKMKPFVWMRYAASLIILMLAGYGLFHMLSEKQQIETVENQVLEIPAELVELEMYYETQVSEHQEILNKLLSQDKETRQEINKELAFLNQEKEALLKEFDNQVSNEKIIEELMSIYRLRLAILQDVMDVLQHKEEQHEKI